MRIRISVILISVLVVSVGPARAADWDLIPSPTTQALYGVASSTPDTWVAVGDVGTIVRSTDAGASWTVVASPIGDPLRGIAFRGSLGLAVAIGGRIIRTTDGGANWTEVARPTHRGLYAVTIDSRMAVATGEEGGIFLSLDDGLTWTQKGAGTASVLFGISAVGDVAVGAGGAGAVVMTVDRGTGWGLTVLGGATTFFYGVSLATSSTGWAVGTYPGGSLVIRTDDSGFVWTAQTAPTSEILFGVSFPTIDTGTAVGSNGAVVHTTDGGVNWILQSSGVTQSLNAVSFAGVDLGIAVGGGGTILRANNAASAVGSPAVAPSHPSGLASGLALESVSPDPLRANGTIRFSLPKSEYASLKLYNLLGEEVTTLASGELASGAHALSFRATGLPDGVYFSRLQTAEGTRTARVVVLN